MEQLPLGRRDLDRRQAGGLAALERVAEHIVVGGDRRADELIHLGPDVAGHLDGYSSSCQGVRIRGPSAVMATVNSKWAASEPSCE